jgi:hypothetical protein
MKEIKEDIEINYSAFNWKTHSKMSFFPRLRRGVNVISIGILERNSERIENCVLKFIWRDKGSRTAETVLKWIKGQDECIWAQDLYMAKVTKSICF